MKNPITSRLPLIAAIAVLIAGANIYAAENETTSEPAQHAAKTSQKQSAAEPIPADAAGTLALVNKKVSQLDEVVAANKLADVHATAFEIRDALLTLPGKVKSLPADQQATLASSLNKIKQEAKLLDKYGDANDAAQTKAVLAKFKTEIEGIAKLAGAEPAADKKDTGKLADAGSIKPANNKLCPITGKPVGSMVKDAHIDYKGYRVGLCCPGCVEAFMKDADANLAKALKKD